jgi:hypothetical protein
MSSVVGVPIAEMGGPSKPVVGQPRCVGSLWLQAKAFQPPCRSPGIPGVPHWCHQLRYRADLAPRRSMGAYIDIERHRILVQNWKPPSRTRSAVTFRRRFFAMVATAWSLGAVPELSPLEHSFDSEAAARPTIKLCVG